MAESPPPQAAPPQKPRSAVVDWAELGRRAGRPAPWVGVLLVAVIVASGFATAFYLRLPDEAATQGRFRFDEVYVREVRVEGNLTAFEIVPWMSNEGDAALQGLRLVCYVFSSDRNLVVEAQEASVLGLAPLRTMNASFTFRLNNTQNYRIELLVLEQDYLIAKGLGSIGFVGYGRLGEYAGLSSLSKVDAFRFMYGDR